MTAQRSKQSAALVLAELADIDRIAFTGDARVVGQQPAYLHRPACGLGSPLDQVVGVFGRADQAQAKLHRLNRPACITEDTQHDLGHCLGPLLGQVRSGLCLGAGLCAEQQQQRAQQRTRQVCHTSRYRGGHIHEGNLLKPRRMMPQR
ncbi:hypothetical protein D3C76_1262380 [compost metagenome]